MKDAVDIRAISIRAVIALITLLLLGKAFHLQVVSDTWRTRADRVGNSQIDQYPARGLMTDRNGKLLTINEPIYQIELTYNQFKKHSATFDTTRFCQLLGITRMYFEEAFPKQWGGKYSPSKPFTFLANVSPSVYATFQENLFQFPGFSATLRSSRNYPHTVAAHLLGYMGEVSQRTIDRGAGRYTSGDYHGISGLEYQYESELRGAKGRRLVYRDRLGREAGEVLDGALDVDATVGTDLITTIDLDLQAYGEALMVNKVGSIVALEPATGEILTMISAPTYDPKSLRIGRDRGRSFVELQRDTLQPLLNRAINGKYPPGSPFKTLVALIAMQTGTLAPDRGISCAGGFTSGGRVLLGCHNHPYCSNVEDAIAQSCNAYFVTAWLENVNRYGSLSPTQGLDEFNDYLYQFGLGSKLGIDFPGEIAGHVPTSTYYNERFQDEQFWRAIWMRSLAIGQGEYELTALQTANFVAAIANRGHWYTPHLVKEVQEGNDGQLRSITPERHDIDIDRRYFETVVRGMRKTVTEGTARVANVPDIEICGKTGTIQNSHGDHSSFVAFAPADDPKIAIMVYVENGGFGGSVAAPIASLMIEKYLHGAISDQRRWVETRMLEKDMTQRGESTIRVK
ncbi:Peptidoglycan D,D-transpeptidase MrdA [Neolewinella maritima]|uniref:Peptidoglycan D,D-transpeptidase MrdA n=1 Tax=Neolewinella maritima TaxID=1383882 RepID=A0ABM9AZN3_9BACT|nr:penicillin-binding protein 2 [Neolewinella maritima]CAH0999789.1 Peptidoglycan D,D-transpeptidase MrdA [Neolewinella maritima]